MPDNKIQILIVDDEERLLRVLRLGLTAAGYDIRTASQGQEAMDEILSGTFDVIITDLKMPVMGGLDLILELERLEVKIPVIVMTAFADVETAVKSFKHGAVDYIRKPFSVEELEQVIGRVLKRFPLRMSREELKTLQQGVEEKEKELIEKALVKARNNKPQAAQILNVSQRTLWYKVKKYGLS